jgi:hypothetical protein
MLMSFSVFGLRYFLLNPPVGTSGAEVGGHHMSFRWNRLEVGFRGPANSYDKTVSSNLDSTLGITDLLLSLGSYESAQQLCFGNREQVRRLGPSSAVDEGWRKEVRQHPRIHTHPRIHIHSPTTYDLLL